MALLDDIIDEATSKDGEVTRLLRLCMVLGSRLQYEPLTEWATWELEGYRGEQSLPSYRVFAVRHRGHFMGSFTGVFDIPLRVLPESLRAHYEHHEERSAIAELVNLASSYDGTNSPRIHWNPDMAATFASKLVSGSQCVQAWTEISPASIVGVLDQVKTRVLNFALKIERELPASRDVAEISGSIKGSSVPSIFNTTILGGVQNLSQGDTTGTTQVANSGVAPGDLEGLISALRAAGVADADVSSLRVVVKQEATGPGPDGKGSAVRKWLSDFAAQSAQSMASGVVAKLVASYLGT